MQKISIRKLARFVSLHPNWALFITLALTILAFWKARSLQIEMDLADLLPDDLDVVQLQSTFADIGSFDFLIVVLEVDDSENRDMMTQASEELSEALDDEGFVDSVINRIDTESLQLDRPQGKARGIAVLTSEDWDILEQKLSVEGVEQSITRLKSLLNAIPSSRYETVLQDPLNFYATLAERAEIKSGPLKVNLLDNYFISEDGRMQLMLVWPNEPATDLKSARPFREFLIKTREAFYIRNPDFLNQNDEPIVNISYYGSHYEASADSELLQQDFYWTSLISFTSVILLFFFAFRRPEALLFVMVPLVIGVTWTLGLSALLVGRLTQVTIVFSAILIGLGIDFSVHLYNRFIEELRDGENSRNSLRAAVEETGPGIIVGAMTTAVAFFGLMITRFEGFRELGLIAGMGVIACLLAVFLVLPPMLSILASGKLGRFTQRPMSDFGLHRFHFTAIAYPRSTLIAMLLITVYFGIFASDIRFEDDFSELQQPSAEYLALQERISNQFDVPTDQLVLVTTGENAQDALELNDQLFDRIRTLSFIYPLVAVDSLRYFIPSNETQRIQLQKMASFDIEEKRTIIDRIARENNLSPVIFEEFLEQLEEFKAASLAALESGEFPINHERLSWNRDSDQALRSIAQRYSYKFPDGSWKIITQIYPPDTEEWQGSVPEVFLDLKDELDGKVELTGPLIIQSQLRQIMIKDLALAVLLIMVLILAILLVYFRNIFHALLALVPVIVGILVTLGAMTLIGMDLHYLNIIALPMIVGIGVDSGIHLIQRFYERGAKNLEQTVMGTGRAVVITSLTTMFGFGSLALADYDGIRELGIVSIIGVGATLLASLVLVPCLLQLTNRDVASEGGIGDDIG